MLNKLKSKLACELPSASHKCVKPNDYFLKNNIEANNTKKPFSEKYSFLFFGKAIQNKSVIKKQYSCPELRMLFDKDEIETDKIGAFIDWNEKTEEYSIKYEVLENFIKNLGFSDIDNFISMDYTFYNMRGAMKFIANTIESSYEIDGIGYVDKEKAKLKVLETGNQVLNPYGGYLFYFD